ncbi:hypothetical protein [Actinoplanes sp. HUAS TT8]|uniref:hypothetical protein n=1 Tax=Actinoplanes sp. HUAS TT8 TaxID=3447453 RepID=UPI003F524015
MGNLNRLVLTALAAASAVVWAIGITVLQPSSEPTGPDAYGENNTYWAREIRWAALIALVLVLIVLTRGAIRGPLAAGAAGLIADLALDRIDKDSGTVELAVGAAVVAVLFCVVAAVARTVPRPGVLFLAATVAAVTSGIAAGTESPTDVETGLNLGSAAVASILAVIAVVAATVAAGPVGRGRARLAVPVGVLAGAVPWALRLALPQPGGLRVLGQLVLVILLVAAVATIARGRMSSRDYLVLAAVTTGITVVLFYGLLIASLVTNVGAVFTRLAANTEINEADEDVILVLLGIPVGLVLGLALDRIGIGPRQVPEESLLDRAA